MMRMRLAACPLMLAQLACDTGGGEAARRRAQATADPAFAGVQERGAVAMGVDQYTSSHLFEQLDDGGRIELQRDADDSAGTARTRRHMREIAARLAAGDFRLPGLVHPHDVPGTEVMAAEAGAHHLHRRAAAPGSGRASPHGGPGGGAGDPRFPRVPARGPPRECAPRLAAPAGGGPMAATRTTRDELQTLRGSGPAWLATCALGVRRVADLRRRECGADGEAPARVAQAMELERPRDPRHLTRDPRHLTG